MIKEGDELKILSAICRVRNFNDAVSEIIIPKETFSNAEYANLAKIALDYVKKYGNLPTMYAMFECLKELVVKRVITSDDIKLTYAPLLIKIGKQDVSDWEFVLDKKVVPFLRERAIREIIELAVDKHLPKGDFEAIFTGFQKAQSIAKVVEKDPVYYWDTARIEKRTTIRAEEHAAATSAGAGAVRVKGISTGIKKLDDILPKGGYFRKELYMFLAPPKTGKTFGLLWGANYAAWSGHNAVLFTCETSTEVLEDRLDALNTDTETKKLAENHLFIDSRLKEKRPGGELIILEYPTKRLTPKEIERQLNRLISSGKRIDFLVVDYLDIMAPNRHFDDELKAQGHIAEELRAIASIFNIPVLTATQVNREGAKREVISGTNISGSFEKIMIADYVISFSATPAEKKNNEMKIHLAESRNTGNITFKIKTAYEKGTFYSDFITEIH